MYEAGAGVGLGARAGGGPALGHAGAARAQLYTFSFTTFFAVGYTLEWDNPIRTFTCSDPNAPKGMECADTKPTTPQPTVNSLSLRFGLALRFRFGDVKPY